MSRDTERTDENPFEGYLRSMPEEAPPADLEERILDALDRERARRPRPAESRGLWLPRLLAAAALGVIILSSQMPRLLAAGEAREVVVAHRAPTTGRAPAPPAMSAGQRSEPAEAPMVLPKSAAPPSVVESEEEVVPAPVDGLAKAPAEGEASGYKDVTSAAPQGTLEESEGMKAADRGMEFAESMAPGVAASDRDTASNRALGPAFDAAERAGAAIGEEERVSGGSPEGPSDLRRGPVERPADALDSELPGPPASGDVTTPGYGLPERFDAPEVPWRDDSGRRQSVTTSWIEVEVRDVEEAYDRANDVLERAHAVFLSRELEVLHRGRARAHLTARVPIDQVDGVIAQLRDLGKVIRLATDSEDRTREYYGQGAGIRQGGATEDVLVAEYEAATDPQRREELYRQILALRQRVQGEKTQLEDLSERTHSVLLEVTLTGRQGPVEFVARALPDIGQAALWVLGTAVLWGPLAVAAWVGWKRTRAGR